MLHKLTIRNYALIDSLDIEFDKGLNIITGETGAGKSIILGALSLILGQRAESKYFFNQDKKCIIEGVFNLSNDELEPLFIDQDLDFFREAVLRREISMDGKSRSFVNDTPVNLSLLKTIGEKLIAIHSQHATQEISDGEFQLLIVDSLANHSEELNQYRKGFKKLRNDEARLQQLVTSASDARAKQDYEQFLLNELNQANLKEKELSDLEVELTRLSNAETIKRNLINSAQLITESEGSATTLLREASIQLQQIEKFDPKLQGLFERLRSTLIELKDIAEEVSDIEEKTVWDADSFELINQRVDFLYGLQQKHKVNNTSELIAIRQNLEASLNELFSSDEEIDKLKLANAQLLTVLKKQAEAISENRKKAIKLVEMLVTATLKQLEMPNASILLSYQPLQELNKDGLDEIKLLFTANAGQPHAPVGKVASGGELSRLMLAIKALLAKHTSLPTLIFDEIDTGISGETALKVGKVIASLGEDMQILSITHLPQIAAKGDSHYFVFKNETKDRTSTGIRKLSQDERIHAIAEMLSGKNPGPSALQNAKELLQ
ncbi:MAG: DNA repair protein RecN [Pedobacter sp.]|nr:MAG: DNA repair protein RecN [Pedobacter sp.]